MKELIDIQNELKAPKGQQNKFGNYSYRSCEDIVEAVKPILKKYDCVLVITDDMVMLGDRFYVKATAQIINSDKDIISSNGFARESLDKKGMDTAQITGAASSYARKYALNGLLAIDDTKDADTMNNVTEDKKPAFTEEVFEVMKKNTKFKNYFEAKQNIDKKYKMDLKIAKLVKVYYEALDKGVDFGDDGTAPF